MSTQNFPAPAPVSHTCGFKEFTIASIPENGVQKEINVPLPVFVEDKKPGCGNVNTHMTGLRLGTPESYDVDLVKKCLMEAIEIGVVCKVCGYDKFGPNYVLLLELIRELKDCLKQLDPHSKPERNGVVYMYEPYGGASEKQCHLSMPKIEEQELREWFPVGTIVVAGYGFIKKEGPHDPHFIASKK